MDNKLYPIFLKLDRLRLLVVGAGEVGYEKMSFVLKSSPNARVRIVAPWVKPEVRELIDTAAEAEITVELREFVDTDVLDADLVIAATNFPALNKQVQAAAKAAGKLVNVADTPALCDFYLGSIVTRGPLKVAVSTNGQSPTFAKRFRQWLEAELPEEETPRLLANLKEYRDRLEGDFEAKVKALNEVTSGLLSDRHSEPEQ